MVKKNNHLYKLIELPLSGKELFNNIDSNISHNIENVKKDELSLDNNELKIPGFLIKTASDNEFYE